jgi:hypothetical protein
MACRWPSLFRDFISCPNYLAVCKGPDFLHKQHRQLRKFSSLATFKSNTVSVKVPCLGTFAKLRKATISLFMSVRLSICMEQLGSHWKDFHEI